MSFYHPNDPRRSFEAALAPFLHGDGLPFADVLTPQQIQHACEVERVRFGSSSRSVYNPAVVLWTFLSQVLGSDKSCRAAALRVLVLSVALERGPCSADTGMYCRARAKLPAALIRRLTYTTADQLEDAVPPRWLWKGRHVHLIDGTTCTMPDTALNQAAFPQPPSQKPGLGFPMIRMVVLLSLATAAVHGMAYGRYEGKETGETALLRQLVDRLRPGHVLLADRFYCSYFMAVLLRERGVDMVVRLHQRRRCDFRRGRRLGPNDHLVAWQRPARPAWMDEETYARMPATLEVREIRATVARPGSRVKGLLVMTTLRDAEQYATEDVIDLYHERWHAELDLRSIKCTLGMETLRCQSPFMVEKELWVTLLGYNLVRKVSCQAALEAGRHPREISFAASLQGVMGGWNAMTHGGEEVRRTLSRALLKGVGKETVGDRPDRCEPRAVKRRPKKQALLSVPRKAAKAALLNA